VAYFDDQGIVANVLLGQRVVNSLSGAMKRKGELQQDAPAYSQAQHIEARADGAFILCGRAGRYGLNIVRESLPEFGVNTNRGLAATRSSHCAACSDAAAGKTKC